jgi:hypothetical protein
MLPWVIVIAVVVLALGGVGAFLLFQKSDDSGSVAQNTPPVTDHPPPTPAPETAKQPDPTEPPHSPKGPPSTDVQLPPEPPPPKTEPTEPPKPVKPKPPPQKVSLDLTAGLPSLPTLDIDFGKLGADLAAALMTPDPTPAPPVKPDPPPVKPDPPPPVKPDPPPPVKPDPPPDKPEEKPDPSPPVSLGDMGIRPPKLGKDPVEKVLPSAVGDVAVGGGGRYLVLYLPEDRKLAVFDINEAKVIHYIPVAGEGAKFTAGQSKLIVALPEQNLLQRWDLATGKREASVASPVKGKIRALAMGSAAQIPLLLLEESGVPGQLTAGVFLDARTFRTMNLTAKAGTAAPDFSLDPFVRASADGNVFTLWRPNVSPQGIMSVTILRRSEVEVKYEHDTAGHVIPGPDGRYLYTSRGRFTRQGKPVVGDAKKEFYVLPAVHGNLFLSLQGMDKAFSLAVHLGTEARPLATLASVQVPEGVNSWDREVFGTDKRIHLIPAAKVLVVIPSTNDRLVLYPFDLEAALEESGDDYLYVTSIPPMGARIGTQLSYQIRVKSKKGGVKYKLESGPRGMEVTETGLVSWTPAFGAKPETDVVIRISDASGQEVSQTFTLAVTR